MPSNRAFLNPNIVQPTKYIIPLTRVAKELPLEPQQLPKFKPFIIDNYNAYSELILPLNTNISDLMALFNLFYIDKIIDKLIEQINAYIDKQRSLKDKDELLIYYKQLLISRKELYIYFNILIYIGITIKLAIKDYQGDLEEDGCSYIVKKYILKDRFQQLNCYIRATKPQP